MVEVSGCGYLGVPSHLFLEDEEMDILTFGDERGDLGFVVEVSFVVVFFVVCVVGFGFGSLGVFRGWWGGGGVERDFLYSCTRD